MRHLLKVAPLWIALALLAALPVRAQEIDDPEWDPEETPDIIVPGLGGL